MREAGLFVVDAALVAKWAFEEANSASALRVLAGWAAGRVELIAPDVLVTELAGVCRRKALRGELTVETAAAVQRVLMETLPTLVPSAELVDAATVLAIRHGRPVTEALHLALALRQQAFYVTADDRTFRALASAFPCVRHVEDVAAELEVGRLGRRAVGKRRRLAKGSG